MDWFHLILRRNLLIQTPNTWVRARWCSCCLWSTKGIFFFFCFVLANFLHLLCFLLCRSSSVNLVSLELTYFCSGLLFAAVVQRRVWDYALTVTLVHVAITSLGEQKPDRHSDTQNSPHKCRFYFCLAVMLEFPMVWQWWLALGKKIIYCIQTYPLSPFSTGRYCVCRQWLVSDDLQRSADRLFHLPERANLHLLQPLLTSFISYVNMKMFI